jgi:hypothetical protein
MGCDIHIYTEARKYINNTPTWANVDNWRYNPYYDKEDPDGEEKMDIEPIYRGRDYSLFSILANVRNWDENNQFISEPRGLPEDVSKQTKAASDRWDSDGHSHSYFTLKELKDYVKTMSKIKQCGLVSQKEAKLLDDGTSTPTTWCKGASPELNLVWREWEDEYNPLTKLIEAIDERKRNEFWIFRKEDDKGEKDGDIRIVFWFDN